MSADRPQHCERCERFTTRACLRCNQTICRACREDHWRREFGVSVKCAAPKETR